MLPLLIESYQTVMLAKYFHPLRLPELSRRNALASSLRPGFRSIQLPLHLTYRNFVLFKARRGFVVSLRATGIAACTPSSLKALTTFAKLSV